MSGDQVRVLGESGPRLAKETVLKDLHYLERRDLQQWIISDPSLVDDELLIIAEEYDKWAASDGRVVKDRLDLLALDSSGQLAVIEIKRQDATPDIHLQAITYAAMVSRFTEDDLASIYVRFLAQRGEKIDGDEARERLRGHADGELDPQLLKQPRLILVGREFPSQVTSSAVWLNEMGIAVKLVEIRVWETGGEPVLTASTRYPVPGTEEFVVAPARSEAVKATQRVETRARATRAVQRLVQTAVLAEGTPLQFHYQSDVPVNAHHDIQAWLDEDPARSRATWVNTAPQPLRWEADGHLYAPTTLAKEIVERACGRRPQAINGPKCWIDANGRSLTVIADSVAD